MYWGDGGGGLLLYMTCTLYVRVRSQQREQILSLAAMVTDSVNMKNYSVSRYGTFIVELHPVLWLFSYLLTSKKRQQKTSALLEGVKGINWVDVDYLHQIGFKKGLFCLKPTNQITVKQYACLSKMEKEC